MTADLEKRKQEIFDEYIAPNSLGYGTAAYNKRQKAKVWYPLKEAKAKLGKKGICYWCGDRAKIAKIDVGSLNKSIACIVGECCLEDPDLGYTLLTKEEEESAGNLVDGLEWIATKKKHPRSTPDYDEWAGVGESYCE